MKRIVAFFGLVSLATTAFAQLVEYPIPSNSRIHKKPKATALTQTPDPTYLPFWDDFSSSDTLLRDSLWLYGNSVLLNNGLGIRPPSKNIVSFDGADSLGKPYNVNDVLAKGFADQLASQPIRMDLVDISLQNTVYISFFYQLQGRGEPPDPGDQLILSLKAQNGAWENVYILETNSTMQPDVFEQVIVQISDPKFFHADFQFRFSNYARLSGPYDTWNVDYVYLNSGRSATDLYYPDRTVSTSFTSMFHDYFAMPVRHFLEDVPGNLLAPSLDLYNLKLFNLPGLDPHVQPINYTTGAQITSRVGGVTSTTTVKLDSAQYPGSDLSGLQYLTVNLNKIPNASEFDPMADSIHIRLKYGMATKDNIPISLTGDYDPAIFSPIDFRYSDSLVANYVLSSYYAYDDGTAEYAAGLNQAGSFLAFLFEMKTLNPDTLVYVDIYFPEFGDNTSQSLLLQIRTILSDNTSTTLLDQLIVIDRKTKNTFTRYPLYRSVPVGGAFYIGWKQLSNVPIPVGLDKNTDNGDKIFYNTNGIWVQNTNVKGSIMVRPGFGKGDGSLVSGLSNEEKMPTIYPNPTSGICYLKGHPESLEVFDITGRKIDADFQASGTDTRITIPYGVSGLVLVRYMMAGQAKVQKLMVRAE